MSIDELSLYIKFMETYCAVFLDETESDDHLWELTKTEEVVYNKFLSPPVSICILCDKALTIRNNPSKAKLFTLNGPVPCTKIMLECRGSAHVYGVCNYTDKSGTRFYQHDVGIIGISDVSYMDAGIYKWLPALRCVCFSIVFTNTYSVDFLNNVLNLFDILHFFATISYLLFILLTV